MVNFWRNGRRYGRPRPRRAPPWLEPPPKQKNCTGQRDSLLDHIKNTPRYQSRLDSMADGHFMHLRMLLYHGRTPHNKTVGHRISKRQKEDILLSRASFRSHFYREHYRPFPKDFYSLPAPRSLFHRRKRGQRGDPQFGPKCSPEVSEHAHIFSVPELFVRLLTFALISSSLFSVCLLQHWCDIHKCPSRDGHDARVTVFFNSYGYYRCFKQPVP